MFRAFKNYPHRRTRLSLSELFVFHRVEGKIIGVSGRSLPAVSLCFSLVLVGVIALNAKKCTFCAPTEAFGVHLLFREELKTLESSQEVH